MKTKQIARQAFLALTLFLVSNYNNSTYAQNIGINATGISPAASAGLDVDFTNKGLLVPRVALTSLTSASPIVSPATSLMVYNTATAGTAPNNVYPGHYYWDGTIWRRNVDLVVERYLYPAAYYAANSTYLITAIVPGATPYSSAFVSIPGEWPGSLLLEIQYVETRNGTVRFKVVTGASTFTGMDFVITVIR